MGRIFKDNTKEINSVDFSDDGTLLISASNDESIHVYDVNKGGQEKTLYSKKYGCANIAFTHSNSACIYASRSGDDAIRYHSLHENKYLTYFKGHQGMVHSLCMNPQNDTFVSGSLDGSIKLWDLKSPTLTASISIKGSPHCSIDPSGKVLGVTSANAIRLYDIRMTDKGPFIGKEVDTPLGGLTSIKFGPRGKTLLTTSQESTIVYDAIKLNKIREYAETINETGVSLERSYTPDEEYVLCGSEDGSIHIFEIDTGKKVVVLEGHAGPVQCCKFNPRYSMIVGACTALSFWIPSLRK